MYRDILHCLSEWYPYGSIYSVMVTIESSSEKSGVLRIGKNSGKMRYGRGCVLFCGEEFHSVAEAFNSVAVRIADAKACGWYAGTFAVDLSMTYPRAASYYDIFDYGGSIELQCFSQRFAETHRQMLDKSTAVTYLAWLEEFCRVREDKRRLIESVLPLPIAEEIVASF